MVKKMMRTVLIVVAMVLVSPVVHADEEVVCDCYIKDDKTSCAVDVDADATKPCACMKETMYGKRKFKEKACVADELDSN
ncbi:MAG: hypothetical protein H2061_07315 [Burkholderiales bacterium]|nr:hypothetical protein [Burkholderiales bacterium]OUT79650.1 MAG: hypothetical protein CBB82_00740 [Betaproteobacteria bacterium TMED22]|tara:strand:+ start:111 stop:350 length:240 start_codon:yes stop_codon:yes gene_type:complete